jgi:alpha-L-fucosidase 2
VETIKKIISGIAALSLSATISPTLPVAQATDNDNSFDPETVMWTNNKIENVLAEAGIYENVKDVNPNASSSTSTNVQNPYGKSGETLTNWAYSEFVWTNSYPIGNGRMAGMVAGGIDKEVIQINEDTCWDGSPYGTLKDESGNTLTKLSQTKDAQTITAENLTSGSKADGWKYFRGADENGNPAPIGSADAIVGDETFRANYPSFANKSISNQALNIDNSATEEAVQNRWNMEKMVEATFLGSPTKQRAYKSFVEVYLDFNQQSENAENYVKSLNMENGIVTVEYDYGDAHFKRESFASYPDQVVVTHVESDKDLDFSAQLHTYHSEKSGYYSYEKISDKEVKVKAAITNGNKDNNETATVNAIQFEARMLLDGDGTFNVSSDNTTVSVNGGKSANIYVVGATNYVDYTHLDNSKPATECDRYMTNVKNKTYDAIKARHIEDFTSEFSKTSIDLENDGDVDYSDTPTEQRVRKDINGKSGFLTGASSKTADANKAGVYSTYSEGDNELAALEFNYGKYLLLSGSRNGRKASGEGEIDIPESQPLNLTGKWNAAFSASWNGKYTININTEMNYWAAQPLNIGESEKPFIDTFDELAESGAITAANQYGIYNERGDSEYKPGDPWVMHHNYDLWRGTQPIDNATAGLWPTGGAWLLEHAWEYYQFNKDEEYLAELYPYMVGAAKFFTQFLVVDPQTGYLVTAASCSPEQGGVQPGPAMDTQLVRNLYDMVEQASEILGKTTENKALLDKIAEQMPSSYLADEQGKIAPNLIDSAGLIKEWARGDVTFDISSKSTGQWTVTNPFKNDEQTTVYNHGAGNNVQHRHCSHLWEMFPGTHLSAYSDDADEQAIFKAYQKSVSARGVGSGQGWGLAWRINLNARALDGNAASTMIEQLFTTRTSPNLFDQHPNFQIDGNYGATSGIIEMLVQSHDGAIDILPALPDTWHGGSINGINTRQDATVDIAWADNKPTEVKVHAKSNGNMNVRSKFMATAVVRDESGNEVASTLNDDSNMITFAAEEGKTYTITDFGSNIVEGTKTYAAKDTTEFYASDNGSVPKIDGNGVDVGYIYNRENVKIGYAVNDFDFDGLDTVILKMSKVRKSDTFVSVTLDTPTGTEIANQEISTGSNELDLKNIAGITGTHKIYILYYRNPYADDDKYIANANDLVATYKKTVSSDSTQKPTATAKATATPTSTPNSTATPENTPEIMQTQVPHEYDYTINSASFAENNKLNVKVTGNDTAAKLIIAAYDSKGIVNKIKIEDVNGDAELAADFAKPESGTVKLFIWDSLETMKPLSNIKIVSLAAETENPSIQPSPTNETGVQPSPTTETEVKPSPSATAPTSTEKPEEKGAYIGETKYETLSAAVAAAEATNPSSEDTRVTIDVMPGTYREQVVVKKPYITIQKKDGTDGEVKLTWYYGLGTLYDSCNSAGYYDPSVIGDGEAYGPKDWGPSLKVDKNATGFTAKGITIENSYNRYYTQEELTDIAGVDPDTNNSNFHRLEWINEQISNNVSDDTINEFLQSRTSITYKDVTGSPRERCAALHCSADKASFIDCEIISTQDTIGINTGRMYFKNCKLGGTTDYICGSATAVFDGCELYANAGDGGDSATITAPSNTAESEGYLFYNCTVTGTSKAGQGNFGRPWSGVNASANYINTTINSCGSDSSKLLISDAGWTSMSGAEPKDARFHEYGSVDSKGNAVSTSKRPSVTLLNEWTMLRYNPLVFTQGSDGWDPAGITEKYSGVNNVITSTTINTSDGSTNEITLPTAPSGYEFNWESDSEFATVSNDGTKLTLIRPAYGENAIKATVKLYVRKSDDKEIGAEKSIEFDIQPTSDTENVFTVSGTVTMSVASDEAQTVKLELKKGDAVIKTQDVELAAGETTKAYSMENIPVGSYTIVASTANSDYNIETAPADITGAKAENKTYDVSVKKMQTIKVESASFTADGYTPTITQADGFTAGLYTADGTETANLGENNVVYKVTKEDGKTVAKNVGVSFDIKSMLSSGSSFANTKTLKFNYDFLLESTDYYPSDYSYFDLATSTTNAGNNAADQTRFIRWGVYKGWGQFNFFTATNDRINGNYTQFDKNNVMANRWYTIVADIDLVNKTITTTLYDRDKDMEILNKKAFNIAVPDENGDNPNYPTDIDLSNLYFNIYMDKKANTTNKIEYYFDNISVEYQDYE